MKLTSRLFRAGIFYATILTGAFATVSRAAESQPIRAKDVIAAVKSGDLSALRGMVKTDANAVFVKEPFLTQNTLMHVAAQSGRTNVLDFLLGAGFNVDVTNRMGETSLFYAAINGQLAAVELLLRQGAAVNAADTNGYTPLSEAVSFGRLSVAEMLLNHGANIEARNFNGATALEVAGMRGDAGMIELLLKFHADVNSQDNFGLTPLHQAAYEHKIDAVSILLNHGADVNRKSKKGYTPLDWCADPLTRINPVVFQLLRERGAVSNKSPNVWAAAVTGDLEPLKSFILKQPSIVTKTTPFTKETLLHRAAFGGHKPTVEFLLSKGAPINAQDDQGCTALHNAVQARHADVAKYLLGSGADPKIKTAQGQTALAIAQSIKQEDLVRILQNSP